MYIVSWPEYDVPDHFLHETVTRKKGSGNKTMLLLYLSLTVTQFAASPVLQPSSPPSSGQWGPLLPFSLPPSSPLPHAGVVWLVPSPVLSCAVPVPHVAWQSQQTSSPYLQEKEVATFHVHKNMWATKLAIAYVITEPLKHIWLLSNNCTTSHVVQIYMQQQ